MGSKRFFLYLFLLFLPSLLSNQPLQIDAEYFLKLAGNHQFYPLGHPPILQSSFDTDFGNNYKYNKYSKNTKNNNSRKRIKKYPKGSENNSNIYNDNDNDNYSSSFFQSRVLVAIPGFGCDDDRTKILLNNLVILNHSRPFVQINCLIFLSCSPLEHILHQLEQSCDLHTFEPASYTNYLKALVPLFLRQSGFTHVLILLDDAQLSYNYRIDILLKIMHQYSLDVISPTVINAVYSSTSCSFCRPRLKSKQSSSLQPFISPINHATHLSTPAPLIVGFMTDVIEIFATLFTIRSWKCFHSMLQPAINSAGWSYDRCFKKYCTQINDHFIKKSTSRNQRSGMNISLGVVDTMIVLHNSQRRTDNDADSINGIPKPAIERNKWLKIMKMEQYLSPEDVFGDPMNAPMRQDEMMLR